MGIVIVFTLFVCMGALMSFRAKRRRVVEGLPEKSEYIYLNPLHKGDCFCFGYSILWKMLSQNEVIIIFNVYACSFFVKLYLLQLLLMIIDYVFQNLIYLCSRMKSHA